MYPGNNNKNGNGDDGDKNISCSLYNVLHELQEHLTTAWIWSITMKECYETMNMAGWWWRATQFLHRKPASPFFKEWYVSHKHWKLRLWHLGHGTEEGPTITSGCFEEPKNPSFNRASDVFCITWSFHLQMVVSFTLTLLKSFLQDFLRVLTQSLR